MLGEQATAWLKRQKVLVITENCPCCKITGRDDVPHALLECDQHQRLRGHHLPQMHGLMRSVHPHWDQMWAATAGRQGSHQRTVMLLQAANMASEAADRAALSGALGRWLQALTERGAPNLQKVQCLQRNARLRLL